MLAVIYFRLTPPFILFHFCGRIGCFFGGCCYGKATDSCLGIVFPDNPAAGIYHNGIKCYPTQLFEAFALLIILIAVCAIKNKIFCYLLFYSVCRFVIEFFRGDERGYISQFISPAQTISIVVFVFSVIKLSTVFKKRIHYG